MRHLMGFSNMIFKIKMKHILYYAIFLLLIISCGNVKNKVRENTNGQLALVFNEQSSSTFFSDRIFGKVEMIPLETTDDCLIGRNPELLLDDHYFFICERQQQTVLRFDKSGKFINRIGRRGGGPGEFQGEIADFDIDPLIHSVEILASGGQILRYNYDGTFISSQNMDGFPQAFIKTGTFYWVNLGVSKLISDGRLLKISEDGTVIEKFLPLETDWFGFMDKNFTRCGDIISFKEAFNHTVYRITDDGPAETAVIDFGRYAFPQNMYGRNQFSVIDELNNKGWASIYRFLENERFVYLSFIVQQKGMDGIDGYFCHWLVNKNMGSSVLQIVMPDNQLFEMIDRSIQLTVGNDLVFMVNAQMLKECSDPFFNSENINKSSLSEESNPVIVKLKIYDF